MPQTRIVLDVSTVEGVDDVRFITFVGDLDATNVEDTVEEVFNVINSDSSRIIADFTDLRYVNSTGLGILLHFSKSAKEKGGFFKICNINSNVFEIIDIIGATDLLDIYETLEEAKASI